MLYSVPHGPKIWGGMSLGALMVAPPMLSGSFGYSINATWWYGWCTRMVCKCHFLAINRCGDRLLAYCTVFNIMFSEVVDLHICICIHTSHCLDAAAALPQLAANSVSGSADLVLPVCYRMTRSHVTATVFKLGRNFSTLLQSDIVELRSTVLWILRKMLSLEFMQCVLWVIRLTKTVESICCAVRHTVALPRAVWQTICSPHSVRVLIATTTVAGCHRPSAACTMTPAVRSISVVYHAVVTTCLLLSACC